MTGGEEHLAELVATLERLAELVTEGKERYEAQPERRLAIQRLWIIAGECARRYCDATGVDPGIEPWSALWSYRNFLAHHVLAEISDDRVWEETITDLSEYRESLLRTRQGGA